MPWFGGPPNGHSASGDGKWFRDNGADFVSEYADYNPQEDWAESFAVSVILTSDYGYTDDWADITDVTASKVNAAQDKLDALDDFFAALSE